MKDEDVKIGMKVVPFQKTAGIPNLIDSIWQYVEKINQPYLFVTGRSSNRWMLNCDKDKKDGDFFYTCDFEPYVETSQPKKQKPQTITHNIKHIINGRKTIVLVYDENNTYKKGEAVCHEEDSKDSVIGFTTAYLRSQGVDEDKIGTIVDVLQKNYESLIKYTNPFIPLMTTIEKPLKITFEKEVKEPKYEVFNANHWQEFLSDTIVLTCEAKEDYNDLMNVLDSMGYVWGSEKNLASENHFSENTFYSCQGNKICYGYIETHERNNCTLTYSERKIFQYVR